jgi:hypothetical protein
MGLTGTIKSIFKRIPTLYLFLIAISPILLSLLIHIMVLIYANRVTWTWFDGKSTVFEKEIPASIHLYEGKKNNRLKFQGIDNSDDFDANDNLHDPVPEIEYRPVVPNAEILPSPKASDDPDIISIEASSLDSKSKWVNPATGGMPLDTGSKMFVGSFSRYIQVLREGGLDVVFVFDSTSSMIDYINEVKLKIINLATTFRKVVPTCRIGLVTYCDFSDEFVTKDSPLTYGINSLNEFMAGIDLCNGGDLREAVHEGLRVAINEMQWNKKSKKFILVIGDAPPHTKDLQMAIEMVSNFRKNGGKLSTLDIRKPRNYTKEYWRQHILPTINDPSIENYEYLTDRERVMDEFKAFAQEGGGESGRLINEEKVIKHMLLLIFGTRWEMYLNEFLTNL